MFRLDKKTDQKQITRATLSKSEPKTLNPLIINPVKENKVAATLAHTCRFLHNDIKALIDERILTQLAYYIVVEPNEDKVTHLLKHNPTLINVVIKQITDNSGRELINNTLFQLAYGAGDSEMCLALKPFFEKAYNSEKMAVEEMEKQRKQKFIEDKEQDKQAKDHLQNLLTNVIVAITTEQFNLGEDVERRWILNPATLAAIETFRTEFSKNQPKQIKKGMHFRNNTLLETFNAYAQATVKWDYNYNKCALFEDSVLSFILRYVPANDAQRFSQGLRYLQDTKQKEKFARSLSLRTGKNNFYIQLLSPSIDFSLSGSAIDIYSGRLAAHDGPGGHRPIRYFGMTHYQSYIEQKNQAYSAYATSRPTTETSVDHLIKPR